MVSPSFFAQLTLALAVAFAAMMVGSSLSSCICGISLPDVPTSWLKLEKKMFYKEKISSGSSFCLLVRNPNCLLFVLKY